MTAPIPDYSKVSLLLPMSGANGGTVFTDQSPTPKTVSRFGNAVTSTSQHKYYGSSAYFDGSGDYLETPHNSAFIPDADLTIAAWVHSLDSSNVKTVVSTRPASGPIAGWNIYKNADQKISFGAYALGNSTPVVVLDSSTAITPSEWAHVAISRAGSVWRLFIDGALSVTAVETGPATSNAPLLVGRIASFAGSRDWHGYIQDVMIVKGLAVWTASFTPPGRLIGSISTDAANPVRDDIGAPAVRSIVAFPRTYPSRLVTTASAADGSFALTGLPATDHTVVYLDDAAGTLYNDLVHRVIPA